jgi:uncharacterized membrane protein YeaQ/YmgE (transglycosylase-associated protein family)
VSILVWIALGLVGGPLVGWLAGSRGRFLTADAGVAVLGAILGGFLASVMLGLDITAPEGTSTAVAALGAGLLLLILHTLPANDLFE